MQKHCAMLKYFSLLVLRLRKLSYGAISASSRLKCLLDRQLHFSRVLIVKSVVSPQTFRSA